MTHKEAKQIMNLVSKYFPSLKLACSLQCQKFIQIMKILGVKRGRLVGLARDSVKPRQGHSVCELMINDKWMCFDVAYNFSIEYSVEELRNNLELLKTHPMGNPPNNRYEELLELYSNIEEYVENYKYYENI